jgi:hypothetical protein
VFTDGTDTATRWSGLSQQGACAGGIDNDSFQAVKWILAPSQGKNFGEKIEWGPPVAAPSHPSRLGSLDS